MKRLRVCENLASKRVDDRREGSKWSDPWRPVCVLLLATGSNKGGVEVTPQSKRLSVSTVHSDSSLHDHTGEENR